MSKTSFFSKAVFNRNLRGYWPLWAVYLGALILLIPVPLHSNLMYGYEPDAQLLIRNFFNNALSVSLVAGAFFAIFAAMAVFSYMYTPRAANMTGSLPIKREALFSTNFLSILFVVVSAHIITAAATVLTIALYNVNMILVLPIVQWIVLGVLMTMFFVCLSCFCATLTGSLLILPCVYGIINFSVILINSLLSYIFSDFLYGYAHYSIPEAVLWLTPSVNLISTTTYTAKFAEGANYIAFNGNLEVAIYTAVGILFLIAGFFIHKYRRTESASDIIAVKPLKPVVKFFFAAVGSLTLGLLINELFFSYITGSLATHIVSMIIGGFVGYFGSEMLVTKSFKVWHKWKGFAAYSLVVILFIAGLAFDIAGFETSIPHKESIVSATVDIYGEKLLGNDPETLDTVIDLHEYIISNRDKEIDYDGHVASVEISYRLKGGAYVERYYYCNIPKFIVDAYNTPERCYERVAMNNEFTIVDIENATIEYSDGYEWQIIPITDEQFYALYNCMISDVGHSSLGVLSLGSNEYVQDAFVLTADFKINEFGGYYYFYQQIPIDALNCIAYLDSLGIEYAPVY
ncbi:MAG: hypothetical protein IJ017_08890 [Oscillospiraceae bacterium]|nr:hypothetical protein [Oscillospiraceae bacterium]